jgi:uncharacterized membrane protein YesL
MVVVFDGVLGCRFCCSSLNSIGLSLKVETLSLHVNDMLSIVTFACVLLFVSLPTILFIIVLYQYIIAFLCQDL